MKYLAIIMSFLVLDIVECHAQLEFPEMLMPDLSDSGYLLQEGSVIGFHFIQTKPNINASENRKFLEEKYFPAWRDLLPGSRVYYTRGERGKHEDEEIFLWVFKNKEVRDYYWPQTDVANEDYQQRRKTIDWLYTDSTFYQYNTGWKEQFASDYLVIEAGRPVEKDWLSSGALIGMHFMKLKKGINTDDFEDFIRNTWAPNRSDAVPGSKVFFLKGIRGNHENEYVFMWVIESLETRDQYYPEKDQVSAMYEKLQKKWSWLYSDEYRGQFFDSWLSDEQSDYIIIN